jgi:hypothetical protein
MKNNNNNSNNEMVLHNLIKQLTIESNTKKLLSEIETSGDWISIGGGRVTEVYLNTNDGRMADESSLHYGDCWDTNVVDADAEFFDNLSKLDLIRIARHFPNTIHSYKMSKIRENAEWLLNQVEGMPIGERMVREIIELTSSTR